MGAIGSALISSAAIGPSQRIRLITRIRLDIYRAAIPCHSGMTRCHHDKLPSC